MPDEAADKVGDVAGEGRQGRESLEQLGARREVLEGQVAVVREALNDRKVSSARRIRTVLLRYCSDLWKMGKVSLNN